MNASRFTALIVWIALIVPGSFLAAQAFPQSQAYPQPGPSNPPYDGQAQPPAQALAQDQLENLVAPIALYPDALLSEILVAATYPLEVVELGQWLQQNRNLRGPDLVAAASRQQWDASIQALVAFPDVVNRLNSDIRWTTDLGNAFLSQQADVMNAVQALRAQARSNGKLQSNQQQIVTTEAQGPQSAIEIQPADPQVVYVPSYNPEYIWGPPAYGYYPPLYYPEFGFSFGYGIPIGGYFGGLGWGGWGWGPNWFGGGIVVNNYFFSRYGFNSFRGGRFGGGNVWAHNPEHRLGVPYSNSRVANNFHGATGGRAPFAGRSSSGFSGGQRYTGPPASAFRGSNQFNGSRSQAAPSQGWSRFGNRGQGSDVNSGGSRNAQSFRSSPSFSGSAVGGGFQSSPRAPSYRSGPPAYSGGANQSSPRFSTGSQSYRSPAQSRPSPSAGSGGGFRSGPRSSPGAQSFRSPAQSRPQASGGGSVSRGGGGGGGGGFHPGGGGSSRSSHR